MRYCTETAVRRVSKELLLSCYSNPGQVQQSCCACPHYGKVWSCPPGIPDAACYLEPYDEAFLTAVKVIYPQEQRDAATTARQTERIRQETYEKVKRELLLTLLELEKKLPGSKCMGAGRCILCGKCARETGGNCRHPQDRRYSVTAFGFDFGKMLGELMDIRLLWSPDGLPEYDVAVAALFVRTGLV